MDRFEWNEEAHREHFPKLAENKSIKEAKEKEEKEKEKEE